MKTAKEKYYEFKEEADLHHEGLCDHSYEYIQELETKVEIHWNVACSLNTDNLNLKIEKAEMLKELKELAQSTSCSYRELDVIIKKYSKE